MLRSENRVMSENDLSAQEQSGFYSRYKKRKLHSEKVICALRDFLVSGYTRREVCDKYNVSLSYFSIALGRISHVNHVVSSLVSYYRSNHHATGDCD